MNTPLPPHPGPWIVWVRNRKQKPGERPGIWQSLPAQHATKADALRAISELELRGCSEPQEFSVLPPGQTPRSDTFASRMRR